MPRTAREAMVSLGFSVQGCRLVRDGLRRWKKGKKFFVRINGFRRRRIQVHEGRYQGNGCGKRYEIRLMKPGRSAAIYFITLLLVLVSTGAAQSGRSNMGAASME